MKTIIALIFLSISINKACCQSCKMLTKEVDSLFDRNQIDSAINVGELAKKICKSQLGEADSNYCQILVALAYMHSSKQEYTIAISLYLETIKAIEKAALTSMPFYRFALVNLEECYEKALNIDSAEIICAKALSIKQPDIELIVFIEKLITLHAKSNEYKLCVPLLLKDLQLNERVYKKNSSNYIYVLLSTATLYYEIGKLDSSEFFFQSSLGVIKRVFGEDSLYIEALKSLSAIAYLNRDYPKVEQLVKQRMPLVKKKWGDSSELYLENLKDLNNIYRSEGYLDSADNLSQLELPIIEKLYGRESENYNHVFLIHLTLTLRRLLNNYTIDSAFAIIKDIKNVPLEKSGFHDSDVVNTYILIGNFYYETENFDSTIVYYKKAIQNARRINNNDTIYINALNQLAELYYKMDDYDNAELLFNQQDSLIERKFSKSTFVYARNIDDLANLYFYTGRYKKADSLYREELSLINRIGSKNEDYANALLNYAAFYNEIGNLSMADSLGNQLINFASGVMDSSNYDYGEIVAKISALLMDLKEYKKAETLLEGSIKNLEKKNEVHNPTYVQSLDVLAEINLDLGNYQNADSLYEMELKIIKDKIGENKLGYVKILENLAYLKYSTQKYASAENLCNEILTQLRGIVGTTNDNYFDAELLLAKIYQKENKNIRAEKTYLDLLTNISKTSVTDLRTQEEVLFVTGSFYEKIHNSSEACSYYYRASEILQKYIRTGLTYLSESELRSFITITAIDVADLEFYAGVTKNDSLIQSSLNDILLLKGVNLENTVKLKNELLTSSDSVVRGKYQQLIKLKNQITITQQKLKDDNVLEVQANNIEKDLMELSDGFQKQLGSINITWRDIQKTLKQNEAIIQYTALLMSTDHLETNDEIYAAYLIRNVGVPRMLFLFKSGQLTSQFKNFDSLENINPDKRSDNYDMFYDNYINQQYQNNSLNKTGLYNLLWQPLDSLLKGIDVIFYSPSGLINRINLEAVLCPDNKFLSEKYQLHLLPNARNIVDYHSADISKGNMLLYGGIQYDVDDSLSTAFSKQYPTETSLNYIVDKTRSGGELKRLEELSGSSDEENAIAVLAKSNNIRCIELSGLSANEESFKYYTSLSLAPSPTIVHISTHGFFFPDPPAQRPMDNSMNQKFFVTSSNPLLRCGLFMAGVNSTLMDDSMPSGVREDGILTGAEISNVNLRQTKLVVLSACETGLGKIDDNEGVYGLQRAFKMSGAQDLIMSLWRVSDVATEVFMTTFYKYAFQPKMNVYDAFAKTQESMRSNREHPEYKEPYYWAAFVLME